MDVARRSLAFMRGTWMVAIRDQRIDIGYGVEKVWRVVYDYRSDAAHRMQTGFVQYDNSYIPVWRAYEPEDSGLDAVWRDWVWRNIHSLAMPNDPAERKRRYLMIEHDMGDGTIVLLPKVEVRLSHDLLEHLATNRILLASPTR